MDGAIYTSFTDWQGEHLKHMGVLGMKWGVRKNPKKTFEKAMTKKNRLDSKAARKRLASAKSESQYQKTVKALGNAERKYGKGSKQQLRLVDKAEDHQAIARKTQARAARSELKAAKWTNAMMKTFGTLSYSEIEKKYGKRA